MKKADKMKLILIILSLSSPCIAISQPDTLQLKSQVPATTEYYSHKDFWRHLDYRDQELRKSPNIEKIDEENLISLIYYFNKFGYPDVKRLGEHAGIVGGVWGHNRYSKINQYTFPIIMAGYKAGAIDESAYRDYYLRSIYQLKFDGDRYKTAPVDSLYSILGIKEAAHLSVDSILLLLAEFHQVRSDSHRIIGRWIVFTPADTFLFNGKTMVKKAERIKVKIYESSGGKYYLAYETIDNAVEPLEIMPSETSLKKFIITGKETSRHYLLEAKGDLILTDDEGRVYKRYHICEGSRR